MGHEKSNLRRIFPDQGASLKRQIDSPAEVSLPKRVGEIFIQTHNLEGVCAKINRLSSLRDSIMEERKFLKSPEARKVLDTAKSMGWREKTYLANVAGVEKDILQWPEDIQKILTPLLEKAKFAPNDRVHGTGKAEVAIDTAAGIIEPKVEEDQKEPAAVIDLSCETGPILRTEMKRSTG